MQTDRAARTVDVAIIGAGAAGLATAIFTARRAPHLRIVALDGARKVGAKILVSGGGRCNVTNVDVTADHYFGGSRHIIRRVLAALPVPATVAFFAELGVPMHVEEFGKYFPDSESSRTVLAALLDECERRGVPILADHRVETVTPRGGDFHVVARHASFDARAVVLATGGLALPKTGSDGGGYNLATTLGHTLVPTTPALAPLVLSGHAFADLAGIAQPVALTVRTASAKPQSRGGPMLWTHFGVSGPAAMDISRVWLRAQLEKQAPALLANLLPDTTSDRLDAELIDAARIDAHRSVAAWLARRIPSRVTDAILRLAGASAATPLAHLARETRRRLVETLTALSLPVVESRGYTYAEATAGGVTLTEIDAATMASRKSPGLFLVGEILDVDGCIGGYNFQWAWSSARVAAGGLEKYLAASPGSESGAAPRKVD
ncbi:MAG: flavoprotein [Planctomycetota bacterium]